MDPRFFIYIPQPIVSETFFSVFIYTAGDLHAFSGALEICRRILGLGRS